MPELTIKPTEGNVALKLLDAEDDDDDKSTATMAPGAAEDSSYNECLYALVIGVGPEGPKGLKKGDTVLVRKYVRDGLWITDDIVIADKWSIVATVSA